MASDGEFRQALDAVVRNDIRPVIDREVPLDGVAEALQALARGDQFGEDRRHAAVGRACGRATSRRAGATPRASTKRPMATSAIDGLAARSA